MIEERLVHFPQSDDSALFENSTLRSQDIGFWNVCLGISLGWLDPTLGPVIIFQERV
jgi:hypothetical protein